jgi:hypothetical protein
MKSLLLISFFIILFAGCITEFIPALNENEEMLVVEGLITDQPGEDTVKIYKTLSIWTKEWRTDLENCSVWITDDLSNLYHLRRIEDGIYVTDPATFRGMPGRKYTLHFTAKTNGELHNYESLPMKMIPVPPIDTIYFEKRNYTYQNVPVEGCQIYLETHDPADSCRFYRWDYQETWEIRLPFNVENKVCWASEKSKDIMIKNTSLLSKNMIERYPMKLITNPVERLGIKYSLLVNQYSLNEGEFHFWEKLQNSVEIVGGLYDIIPSTIPGNIYCHEDKLEKVLGYFSVSAVKSKRLFIKEKFIGKYQMYENCVTDTAYLRIPNDTNFLYWGFLKYPDSPYPRNLDTISQESWNATWWVLNEFRNSIPPMRYVTNKRWCGDCTAKGTNIKPFFWDDYK